MELKRIDVSTPDNPVDTPALWRLLEDNCWRINHTAASLEVHRTTPWRLMLRLVVANLRSEA